MNRVDALCDVLRAKHERVTRARRSVIEVLVRSKGHLTAEDIHERVKAIETNVHRATVYRALDTLTHLGITEHTHLGHGPAVYHLADDAHQHLVCEVCDHVIEAPRSLMHTVERRALDEFGFQVRGSHFAIVGLCERCAEGSS